MPIAELFDAATGALIGPATEEQVRFSKGMHSGELFLRPDGSPSGHSADGKWRKVRVETRPTPEEITQGETRRAAAVAAARQQERFDRRVKVGMWIVAAWFAFGLSATLIGSLVDDGVDRAPTRYEDHQNYPDLCWTQSGQEPC